MADVETRGWFDVPGTQEGERALSEQLEGLERLGDEVSGRAVLDVGCAEGLIGLHLASVHGARLVIGVDPNRDFVARARQLVETHGTYDAEFHEAALGYSHRHDRQVLGRVLAGRRPDVVLLLSVLHKMHYPETFLEVLLTEWQPGLVVVRAPPPGVFFVTKHSRRPVNLGLEMESWGYALSGEDCGPRESWVGYFGRRDP